MCTVDYALPGNETMNTGKWGVNTHLLHWIINENKGWVKGLCKRPNWHLRLLCNFLNEFFDHALYEEQISDSWMNGSPRGRSKRSFMSGRYCLVRRVFETWQCFCFENHCEWSMNWVEWFTCQTAVNIIQVYWKFLGALPRLLSMIARGSLVWNLWIKQFVTCDLCVFRYFCFCMKCYLAIEAQTTHRQAMHASWICIANGNFSEWKWFRCLISWKTAFCEWYTVYELILP